MTTDDETINDEYDDRAQDRIDLDAEIPQVFNRDVEIFRTPTRWAVFAHWRLRRSVGPTTVTRRVFRWASNPVTCRSATVVLTALGSRHEEVLRFPQELLFDRLLLQGPQLVGGAS